jgi:VIT1/CCC1 family predicted Fe2+/Mn2+ transporter
MAVAMVPMRVLYNPRMYPCAGNLMHEVESWEEEKRAAYLYHVIAGAEAGTPRESLFRELAAAADRQADIWADAALKAGARVPPRYVPDLRTRTVSFLVRRSGPYALRGILAAVKVRGMAIYAKGPPGHFISPAVQGPEHRHRDVAAGGNLRAAVFGINDGLVSNASLIMGVAGAGADARMIALTGFAGLVAGAFSMAAGEYVSVRSQREMYEYQIGLEREELDQYPKEEAKELALVYAARGVAPDEAQRLADSLIANRELALDTLAREELGLNPDALGSPRGAALSSFASFACGGAIPVLPFVFGVGSAGLALAIALTAIALFSVGAAMSLFTGRAAFMSGTRMLIIGAAAGATTYAVGRLLGVSLS